MKLYVYILLLFNTNNHNLTSLTLNLMNSVKHCNLNSIWYF